MAEGAEPMVKCDNCEAQIPESKSFLHESYCRRNVIRCKKCNKPIDKSEVETHEKEAHALAPCKFCKKEFEPAALANHSNYCEKKPRLCQFCNCEVAGEEFNTHIYSCGSRTKKCSICSKNIMIRDFDFHEQSCELNSKNYEKAFPEVKEEKKVDKPTPNISQPKPKPTSYGIEDKPTTTKTTSTTTTNSASTTTNIPYNKPSSSTGTNTVDNKYNNKPSGGVSTSTTSTSTSTNPTSSKTDKPSYGMQSQDIKKPIVSTSGTNTKPSGSDSYKTSTTTSTQSSSKPTISSQQPKKKTQEEIDAEIAKALAEGDDDEAIARKLQEELYGGNTNSSNKPKTIETKPQPKPSDLEEYNEYNLNDSFGDDEDPELQNIINESKKGAITQPKPKPSNNIPSYDPFAQADVEYQQGFGGEDAEIQKAIEESLKATNRNTMGDTMNSDEFKRAIELSKKFK